MTIITVIGKQQPFAVIYDPQMIAHLAVIEPKYHSLIRGGVEDQLRFEPETTPRNRKPLERGRSNSGRGGNYAWVRIIASVSSTASSQKSGRFESWPSG